MNALDIILLIAVGIGMIFGSMTGLVKQLTLGAGVAVGLLQATIFYQQAGIRINELSGWETWICNTLGFILIFFGIAIVINFSGIFLKWLLKKVLLGWFDRLTGAIFSTFIAILAVAFMVKISNNFFPDNSLTGQTSQKESMLYKEVAEMTFTIIDEVKEEVKDEMEID